MTVSQIDVDLQEGVARGLVVQVPGLQASGRARVRMQSGTLKRRPGQRLALVVTSSIGYQCLMPLGRTTIYDALDLDELELC